MKKKTYQLLLLCSLVGFNIFFRGNVSGAEQPTYSTGTLPVRGSIGKTEDERTANPIELGNELVDIRVLIPKERSATIPQTGEAVSNWFIKVLGMVLVVIGLSYFVKHKREKGKV